MDKEEILKLLEEYGKEVDPQGWEIPERYEIAERIFELFTN